MTDSATSAEDWQSYAALAVVALVLAAFMWRSWRRSGSISSGCGGGCECGHQSLKVKK